MDNTIVVALIQFAGAVICALLGALSTLFPSFFDRYRRKPIRVPKPASLKVINTQFKQLDSPQWNGLKRRIRAIIILLVLCSLFFLIVGIFLSTRVIVDLSNIVPFLLFPILMIMTSGASGYFYVINSRLGNNSQYARFTIFSKVTIDMRGDLEPLLIYICTTLSRMGAKASEKSSQTGRIEAYFGPQGGVGRVVTVQLSKQAGNNYKIDLTCTYHGEPDFLWGAKLLYRFIDLAFN